MRHSILTLILLSGFFFNACQAEEAFQEKDIEQEDAEQQINEQKDNEDEQVIVASSRELTLLTASSVLEDDSGYGFAYVPENVFDLDYSTAWCASSEDMPTLILDFSGPVLLDVLGIMPGFARDEVIFSQNNRPKTIELWLPEGEEPIEELHLEDSYNMQFFDMPSEILDHLILKITEVYPGSKYSDTCLSEVDFWSEYVFQKDADAAYNYYTLYKEASSLRPVGVQDVYVISMAGVGPMSPACGSDYDTPPFRPTDLPFNRPWIGAYTIFNDYTEVGDEMEFRVVEKGAFGEGVIFNSDAVEVKRCDDGKLYVLQDLSGAKFGTFGTQERLEIYWGNKLIGSETFVVELE